MRDVLNRQSDHHASDVPDGEDFVPKTCRAQGRDFNVHSAEPSAALPKLPSPVLPASLGICTDPRHTLQTDFFCRLPILFDPNKIVGARKMPDTHPTLVPLARIPHFRVLAWSEVWLYVSRGYEVLRAHVQLPVQPLAWKHVGSFRPNWKRSLSVKNRLTARLFRDGFHALAVLPSGKLIAAVAGAIVTLDAQAREFRQTHTISRGTRPLHVTTAPNGLVYWGEYFDNASRDEVHIYASSDQGLTWHVAHTFPKGAIRHVHNIVHDPWQDCLWILTGDYGDECRILRASINMTQIEPVLKGNQRARAVAAVPTERGLYFSSDTPLEPNFIYLLDRKGSVSQVAAISSSSIYGCRVGTRAFFSTMVEPSKVNRDPTVRVYGADINQHEPWQSLLSWRKDEWPMGLFQYGNAFLPDGNNETPYFALTTMAVKSEDAVTSIYAVT